MCRNTCIKHKNARNALTERVFPSFKRIYFLFFNKFFRFWTPRLEGFRLSSSPPYSLVTKRKYTTGYPSCQEELYAVYSNKIHRNFNKNFRKLADFISGKGKHRDDHFMDFVIAGHLGRRRRCQQSGSPAFWCGHL